MIMIMIMIVIVIIIIISEPQRGGHLREMGVSVSQGGSHHRQDPSCQGTTLTHSFLRGSIWPPN